jgi:FtsP/CotA-like multicopper oxidase with cupredoxin domain
VIDSHLTRRALLKRTGALALAASTWSVLGSRLPGAAAPAYAATPPFTLPLRFPREVTGPHVNLQIAETFVQVFPEGPPTRMWTYGGEFPGPTIRRPAGKTTRVTFKHRLPAADTLTVHHHGHHTAAKDDGQPSRELIAPGKSRTYTYEHVEEGKPGRGAMRWYHDHSHGRTGRNSWMGLAGLFIVEDEHERALGLPAGDRELPLVITERSFDALNQLTDPFTTPQPAGFDDAVGSGNRSLVNGVPEPFHAVAAGQYRLRVLNASNFHPYNLQLGDGLPFFHIGTESGLLPGPVQQRSLLLGPAERADLIVDFSEHAGQKVVLRSVATDRRLPATTPLEHDLVEFRVGAPAGEEPASLPVALRPLPGWVKSLSKQPDRVFTFGLGVDPSGTTAWTVNGLPYDPERIDARPELGSTETWLLVNTTPQATSHYIHLHGVDWMMLSRNGAAPPPGEDGLKETFRLDPGEAILVGAKFTDHLGTYMVHCHMLNHEDHAMMTQFEVVPRGQGDRPGSGGPSAPAKIRGRRVRVPLAGLTVAEQVNVRRLLGEMARRPGAPAAAPRDPAPISAAAMRKSLLCELGS